MSRPVKQCICLFWCIATISLSAFSQPRAKSFLVCGDNKVLLVDYSKSRDTIPEIIWSWEASKAKELPDDYRFKKFNSIDDCKPIKGGKQILVSSSSGAIALLKKKNSKVLFYASVPNAHSLELLPRRRVVAAASTDSNGNKLILFCLRHPDIPIYTDSLYSAHGVVWNGRRKRLYALGYDQLREYKVVRHDHLELVRLWQIPGVGGHDLQLSPDGKSLFLTEHTGCWKFDTRLEQFSKLPSFPDNENVKSLGQDKTGQYIFTVPEVSWWTHHVAFHNPSRQFVFRGMKVYKARWFRKKPK